MQDGFSLLPTEIFLHTLLLSFLNSQELTILKLVSKTWKENIDELLYKEDLITTLTNDLTEDQVKEVIEIYKTKLSYQLIHATKADERNPWDYLTHSIVSFEAGTEKKLARAFFTVISKLPVTSIAKFITNFRITESCKAFLKVPENQRNLLQTICHALLCDKISEINSEKLDMAKAWAYNCFRADNKKMLLLKGLNVTLSVKNGKKELPKTSDYYINLRGADLSEANLVGTDFRLMDLHSAKLWLANIATDRALLRTQFPWLIFAFNYIVGIDMSSASLSIRFSMTGLLGLSEWFLPSSTNPSNLDNIDLRNADLDSAELGKSTFNHTNLTNTQLTDPNKICETKMDNTVFFDKLTSQTISSELDKLHSYVNVKQLQEAVANNIVALTKNMPVVEAVLVLQKAIDHPFFSPKHRQVNWLDRLSNAAMMIRSGQTFFRSFNMHGKEILEKALEQTQRLDRDPKPVRLSLKKKIF